MAKIGVRLMISSPRITSEQRTSIDSLKDKICKTLTTKAVQKGPERSYVSQSECEHNWLEKDFEIDVPEDEKYEYPDQFFQAFALEILKLCNDDHTENEIYLTPLCENSFFYESVNRVTNKNLNIESSITFGALVGHTSYYEHTKLEATSNFEHGSRRFSIHLKTDQGIYQFALDYGLIKHIVINNRQDEGGHIFIFTGSARMKVLHTRDKTLSFDTVWHRVSSPSTGITASEIGDSSMLQIMIPSKKELNIIIADLYLTHGFKGRIHYATMRVLPPSRVGETILERYPFENQVYYALHCLWQRGYVVKDQVDDEFLGNVLRKSVEDTPRLLNALHLLTTKLDNSKSFILKDALDKTFQRDLDFSFCNPQDLGCKMVRRVIITPTRILPQPPEMTVENRFLRDYGEENALRVSFRDEDLQRLNDTYGEADDELYSETIVKNMENGLKIGGQHYKFLGWSVSQLCDHSCWMFANDKNGNTADSIRQHVGDLSDLKRNVSKYMARLGQIFTHSQKSVKHCKPEKCPFAPDIERIFGGKKYCFSDGIGKISKTLMDEMVESLSHNKNPMYKPSAAQIRYGGCKGMIAVDTTLEGKQLVLRESMKKFESKHSEVEVVKLSEPVGLYLNRYVIAILSDLGIKDSVFLKLQEDALNDISESLLEEEKAIKLLDKRVRIGIDFKAVSKAGFHLTTDTFFSGLLRALAQKNMGSLKRKSRIELSQNKARNMFGVLDETGVLQEGEVFVQYSENIKEPGGCIKVVDGDILVTKNPAMHIGDVRKFTARKDIPTNSPLWSLHDVLVFPQNGRRPHPNEMAGSDLDGDEYFVTWMKELIFEGDNRTPMDFPSSEAKVSTETIDESDMIQFLADFIKNDRKGIIARAHLAHADQYGVTSKVCLSLAEKYSKAVDFQKTGYCPTMDKKERPNEYPHFMEKLDKKTYNSKKILGTLFTIISDIEDILGEYSGPNSSTEVADEMLWVPMTDPLIRSARSDMQNYNNVLTDLMSLYGVTTESEVMSGCLGTLMKRINPKDDTFDTEILIKMQVKSLWKRTREHFFKDFGGESNVTKPYRPEVIQKAKAYYTVAYFENEQVSLGSFGTY